MLAEPKCYTRQCKHYLGFMQPNGTEMSEVNYCFAFPNGIPKEIAYGDNPHTAPFPGDHGIVFEAKE